MTHQPLIAYRSGTESLGAEVRGNVADREDVGTIELLGFYKEGSVVAALDGGFRQSSRDWVFGE